MSTKGLRAYNAGDYQTALTEWRPLAEQGDSFAQYGLGLIYANSDGVLQDYAEAAKWYRRAAEQGNEYAQNNLGVMYKNGQGVLQDHVLAHMWANIAAANGHEPKLRDLLAQTMTPGQIAEAQRRARVCMESGYQDCG